MDLASSLRLLPEHQGLRLATSPPALLGTKRRCPPTSWQPPQESRASSPALCARASSPTSLATSLQQRPAAAVPAVLPEPSPQDQPSARTPQEYLKAIAPEIVRHVHEAPVFHLIFDKERGQEILTERKQVDSADVDNPDSWPHLRQTVLASEPDAVVLVHRLSEEDLSKRYGDSVEGELPADSPAWHGRDLFSPSNSQNTWGLVVLGRSSRRHACYILQTTRVFSPAGAATHFSFTKAKCFGPSLHQQIEQSWLA